MKIGNINYIYFIVCYRLKTLLKSRFRNRYSGKKVWVNPQIIVQKFTSDPWPLPTDWKIITSEWPFHLSKTMQNTDRFKCCIQHWGSNVPWEDTGIFNIILQQIHISGGEVDGCLTINDVSLRYQKLDLIFQQIKKNGFFKSLRDSENEFVDILVHIGPNGLIYHGHNGNHRIAMTNILNIPIQVTIGSIDSDALPYLRKLIWNSNVYRIHNILIYLHKRNVFPRTSSRFV